MRVGIGLFLEFRVHVIGQLLPDRIYRPDGL